MSLFVKVLIVHYCLILHFRKLMLTKNRLVIVEVDLKDSNKICSLVNHSLGTILNIKCRKKRPDMIIFEYSGNDKLVDR